jgi:hypothetical protein
MVVYSCDVCNFVTILKGNYKQHLKTKKHLKNSEVSLECMVWNTKEHKKNTKEHKKNTKEHKKNTKEHKKNTKEHAFLCDYCGNQFNSYASKRRHELHFCKDNDDVLEEIINTKNKKIKKLESEKRKMKKEIEKLLTTVGNVTNNNNTTNNIIVVNNYGKENKEYLTEDYLKKLLDKPFGGIQQLIKKLHFHPMHPENHNVKITNKKLPYALVWNDKIWETRKKKEVISDLVDKGYMILDTTYENIDENSKYIKFQDSFESNDNTKYSIEEDTEMIVINESKKIC